VSIEKKENNTSGKASGRRRPKPRRRWLKDSVRPPKSAGFENHSSAGTEQTEYDFFSRLKEKTKGLIYISETDADIQPFIGETTERVSADSLLSQIGAESDGRIEEREFTDFFGRLTTMQDWFDDERREMTEQFTELEKLLTENLKDLKVFKVGEIEIDIYVVGLDKENRLAGVRTQAVET
jgi:hypothetical protein